MEAGEATGVGAWLIQPAAVALTFTILRDERMTSACDLSEDRGAAAATT